MSAANPVTLPLKGYAARHVRLAVDGKVATHHARPAGEEEPAHLRELRRAARPLPRAGRADDVRKAVVIAGAGGNFCSGGDVHEIIGPLTEMNMPELLDFTRMTGDLVKAMRACPQPIVAAVDGVCAGAGAIIAMASDLRIGTAGSEGRVPVRPRRPRRLRHGRLRHAAAHHRPGPRRRAAVHRPVAWAATRRERWGFFNRLVAPDAARARRTRWPPSSPTARPSRTR